MDIFSSRSAVIMDDNQIMIRPASSPLRRIFQAPFSRRTWAELAYALVSALLAVGAVIFIVPMLANGLLWGLSASGVRKLNAAARSLDRALLGDVVPAPPRLRSMPIFWCGRRTQPVWPWPPGRPGARSGCGSPSPVAVKKLSPSRIAEVAATAGIAIDELRRPAPLSAAWAEGFSIRPAGGPGPTSR